MSQDGATMALFGAATKRGFLQISPAFLKAAEERWIQETQDGGKVAKTVLEASGEPSELRS